MPIKVTFDPEKSVRGAFEKLRQYYEERLIQAFRMACMEAVNYAKGNQRDGGDPRYTDRTGALNSSTGFQLYRYGELVDEHFVGEGGDGTGHGSGVAAGKRAAAEASTKDKLISAVVVAGMHYAIYVEAKGKDVLTGAELKFHEILERWLREAFSDRGIEFTITPE